MNNRFASDGLLAAFLPSFKLPGEKSAVPPHPTAATTQRLANSAGPHAFQVIVMHTKSNFVNEGATMWNGSQRWREARRPAIGSSARQRDASILSAQGAHVPTSRSHVT